MVKNAFNNGSRFYKPLLIWCLSFAFLLGPTYNLFLSYDYKSNPDCLTYLAIAKGDFANQNLVRKYRVVVPFMAKGIAMPIEKVYRHLWPLRVDNDNGPLRLGFLLVNLSLMSFVGVLIFYLLKAYRLSNEIAIFVTLIVLLGGRWGNLFAAIPITDSLYMLLITLSLYAIKVDKFHYLIPCLLLGTMAKEAYIMLIPYLFFVSNFPKVKLLAYTMLGLAFTYFCRYYIDALDPQMDMLKSVQADISHFDNIMASVLRVCSVRGIGEMNTLFGVFTFVFLAGCWGGKKAILTWLRGVDVLIWLLLPIALVHAMLSTEVSRMMYLFAAPLAVIMGLIIRNHPLFVKLSQFIQHPKQA